MVVTGNNAEALCKHLSDVDVECVYNEIYASTDMYYSACMGLNHIRDKTGRVFFYPAMCPFFPAKPGCHDGVHGPQQLQHFNSRS